MFANLIKAISVDEVGWFCERGLRVFIHIQGFEVRDVHQLSVSKVDDVVWELVPNPEPHVLHSCE